MVDTPEKLLEDLLEPQKEAVLHRGSPLLIVAGPGSGKTEVLSRRVAHLILSGDVRPENMLVTTFTNKAALELKDRIQQKLPEVNVELMQVSTLHSFFGEILRRYLKSPSGDFRILDEMGQFLFVYSNRKALGLDEIVKGLPHQFFQGVIHSFNLATEEMVEPSKLEAWCSENSACCCLNDADQWKERAVVAKAYSRYLDLLKEEELVDFAILQRRALDLLQDKKVLSACRESYREILVDEYQDTNAAQDKILSLLAGCGGQLTVVGDDDQSIYRFRGATVKNIGCFHKRYPNVKMIKLEHNFRSLNPIVKNSLQVIVNNQARIPKDLKAVREGKTEVFMVHRHTATEEARAVVELIEDLRRAGKIAGYGDIALLLRSVKNAAGSYVNSFAEVGIPFHITGYGSFFERGDISGIFELLKFLGATKSWGDCYIRNPLVGLGCQTRHALQEFKDDLLRVASDGGLKSIGVEDQDDRRKLLRLLELKERVQSKKHSSLLEVYYRLLAATGCVSRFEKERDLLALLNLGQMSGIAASWDEYGKTKNHYPFLQYLKLLKDGKMNPASVPPENGAVRIMTIHQAKGLEFPVVIIGSAMNGRLPTSRRKDPYEIPYKLRASGEPEVMDPHMVDERKLFYVAATRARDLLLVGTADVVNKRGGGPSSFVREMFGDELQAPCSLKNGHVERVISQCREKSGPRPRHSFSQLAYFLQCPMRYKMAVVYGFRPPWLDPVGYGANVHRALQEIHTRAIEGRIPRKEDVPEIVSQTWISNRRTKPKREEQYKSAAIGHLGKYVEEHESSLSAAIRSETGFSFSLQDQVMLGKIDLLKREKNGGIDIVDFKTSKASELKRDGIDLQLDLYALGAEESLGFKVDKTTVHFLGDGKLQSNAWSEERKEKAISRLASILNKIEKGDFPPNHEYCSDCDEFREICPFAKIEG
ncbi:ATP-dependent DNA helicase Rep [uncultured archaeon]|nr:ATP-dependent DNA helicase Rep [uncultured archaeon]